MDTPSPRPGAPYWAIRTELEMTGGEKGQTARNTHSCNTHVMFISWKDYAKTTEQNSTKLWVDPFFSLSLKMWDRVRLLLLSSEQCMGLDEKYQVHFGGWWVSTIGYCWDTVEVCTLLTAILVSDVMVHGLGHCVWLPPHADPLSNRFEDLYT